jgi:hypothetical protein
MHIVKTFLRQAEDILDVAVAADGDAGNLAILIDSQGGMRMLDPVGWSLPALCAEYGARAVYTVERRARTVRVEGWGGGERCLIQRNLGPRRLSDLPASPASAHPMMLQRRLPEAEQRVWSA